MKKRTGVVGQPQPSLAGVADLLPPGNVVAEALTAPMAAAAAAAPVSAAAEGHKQVTGTAKPPRPATTSAAAAASTAPTPQRLNPSTATSTTSGAASATVPAAAVDISQPAKRVKKEQPLTPGTSRREAPAAEPPSSKRPKQLRDASTPSPCRGIAPSPGGLIGESFLSNRIREGEGIAFALGEVRAHLLEIIDVEGVKELLERFPECVLLGGIAACRELVAALLGDSPLAISAAAVLVAPGMRQPLALEFRSGGHDFNAWNGDKADNWLRNIAANAQPALGSRLKVESLRLRLAGRTCVNLDVVHLPDRGGQGGSAVVAPKIEEMRMRHIGSSANILVCLEPGTPLDLCRRFDPGMQRTVLIGAAAGGGDTLPAAQLCGPSAARNLEERFAALCHERVPQWMVGLEKLEMRLSRSYMEARDVEQREASEEVLRRARAAGLSFGRALQEVISGAPGCSAGALTLEEELIEFAAAAAKGQCGSGGTLLGEEAAASAADLFAQFDGVESYASYLRSKVQIPGADVPLNGGAAWQRLLGEIEVAMRLATPPPEELATLGLAAIRAGGTGVHGHQRWEDVASKLMLSIAFRPLLRRVRYVSARVIWVLKHQKTAVSEWMSTLSDGPASRIYSPLFAQHLAVLRASPIVRDLVFGAFDQAVATVGETVLKNLSGTLMAACINPEIMLRPKTECVLDPADLSKHTFAKQGNEVAKDEVQDAKAKKSGRAGEARSRVAQEMRLRSAPSGGLPLRLKDCVFDPKDTSKSLPLVEMKLRRAFTVLADVLATQAFAFADASMSALCRRQVDEAMSSIEFSPEERRAITNRHLELMDVAKQVQDRLNSVRRCISVLRSARS